MKRKLKASCTIEVSLIMPFIIFIIWDILFLSFFYYDQTVAVQGSYQTALRTERLLAESNEKEKLLENKFRIEVTEAMATGRVQKEHHISEKKVEIKTKLSMRAPGNIFQTKWRVSQEQTAETYAPVAFIRKCRRVENSLSLLGI